MSRALQALVLIVAIATGLLVGNHLLQGNPAPPLVKPDGWWGRGRNPVPDHDTSIHKFEIKTSAKTLKDLKRRLNNTRLGEDLEDTQFQYGFQVDYMKEVLEYWKTQFDWKKQERELNKFEQFKTKIEGIDIHFVRVKPKVNKGAKPLLMIHGWPGSMWEFYKAIPMLTDPTNHGGSEEEAFEVICPSIPGYGFSEAPHQQGFNALAAARVFVKLMERLGFKKFYVQGGDWGGLIGTVMAQAYPQHLLGVHLNMFAAALRSPGYLTRLLLGYFCPSLVGLKQSDVGKMYPVLTKVLTLLDQTGYMHIQATRPDTIAFSLNDSPVGLAAYIMEKFGEWTNPHYIERPDGGLTQRFSMDELLTNVMIYWITGSIGSSVRFYRENTGNRDIQAWESIPVKIPVGLASFPHEIVHVPEAFAALKFRDIVQHTDMPAGGHFAAFEEPELLVTDIRSFTRKVENRNITPDI